MHHLKRKLIKGTAALLASIIVTNLCMPTGTAYAGASYDYSNAIYTNGMEDEYVHGTNDKVVTTKTGIKRTIPKTTGKYDRSYYPIPLVNKVPSEKIFEMIKEENKELMDQVETAIEQGTLTKHVAADGQFYGSISDETEGVEKKIYVNTNSKGTHSLASYVPAGEIATVTLGEEALPYVKKGWIKISMGMTEHSATQYKYNSGTNNRMPYLGKTFTVKELKTKVGTPFGGMIFIEINSQVPSGLQLEVEVKGVVDTPYYDWGQTTSEEWEQLKDAPGLFAEVRTPYLRFIVPSYFIREIEGLDQACEFWTKATALSSTLMGLEERTTPMTMICDDYITAGIAYAAVGSWSCTIPNSWATSALDYENLLESGSWGVIHEINHHYQRRYAYDNDEWGLGPEFSEITNNALSAISYILYTNIAAYRGENGTDDWNKVADPYSSLKQQIFEGTEYYEGVPNIGNFVFSTLAHELGPVTLAEIIKSTYDGGTFNGIEVEAYDYKAEGQGKKTRDDRYDDYAYRITIASKRDYTWYLKEALGWKISDEMVQTIEAFGYEKVIPVQSVYGMGEVGRETGRPYYVPSNGYVFDFENSLVSPGEVTFKGVSEPKYGTLTKMEDGTYSYMPDESMPEGAYDEFTMTVVVEADGIKRETKLNCTIGLLYNGVTVEHHAITKWNVDEALEALKTSSPYRTASSCGMKIVADNGNNLAKASGYFTVSKSGEYTFQAYGDDRAVFWLKQNDGTILESLTVDYAANVENAYVQEEATHFTAYLEAGTPYEYTIIANNNGDAGWADVRILGTEEGASWKEVDSVSGSVENLGKSNKREYPVSEAVYKRSSTIAVSDGCTLKGVEIISNPNGVAPNNDANSRNEGDPNAIVDGDVSTYFHSSYTQSTKTPMPHDYVFDLGSEQSFNQMDILYRRTGDDCGVIGNYEIYTANQYDGSNTKWTKVASDETRKGNASAPNDIKVSVSPVTARYVMLRVLNNRGSYDLSILAEVTFSMHSNVAEVIAQNSSYIQYDGRWTKDSEGAFVNGATYNTKTGYFMYCFTGSETNIYVAKDAKAEVRVDGGEWKSVSLAGSLREPSVTLTMENEGQHSVEVRAVGEELALNMISSDGSFYKGSVVSVSNTLAIHGAEAVELPVGQVSTFDALAGISYTDELGFTGLEIEVEGELGVPSPGTKETYKLFYTVSDCYKNTAAATRLVTVTNQVPQILGLSDIRIKEGEGSTFDYALGVTATDYEDGSDVELEVPTLDLSKLPAGEHKAEYKAKDSDGNVTVSERMIYVEEKEDSFTQAVTLPKLTVAAKAASASEAVLTWNKVSEATGYKVYRYNKSAKRYDLVSTITNSAVTSYKDRRLSGGTAYTYKVAAYKEKRMGKEAVITVTTKLATPKAAISATAKNSITVKWSKVTGAAGYKVYRYNTAKKKYEQIKTITKASTVSYKDSKLASATTYRYRVVAYKSGETTPVSNVSATTKPETVKISKVTTTSKKATIRWKKAARVNGYEVYQSTKKKGTYKKVATIKKAKTTTATIKKLKGNTTYYYKVRAYKTVNGKKIYGSYSKAVSIKVKK